MHDRPVVRDLDEFLELGIDYAVVAAPTIFHLDMGTRLAEAGVHALIEKPVASTAVDARTLSDLFAGRGLIGGVGHIERYNPALQAARERIEDGLIGDIYQIATRRQGPFPAASPMSASSRTWRRTTSTSPRGSRSRTSSRSTRGPPTAAAAPTKTW